MTNHEELIEGLNELLEKTYDAEKGYKQAYENSDNTRLKAFFKEKSDQRYKYGHQLKEEIRKLGGEVEKGGSVAGSLHRTWIDIKAALSFDTEESILEECERGEKASLKEYDEFLKEHTIPTSTRSVIVNQRNGIAKALKDVDMLEEQFDD